MAIVAGSRALRWLVCFSLAALGVGVALPASGVAYPEPDAEPVTVSTAYSGPGFDPCWAPSNSEMDAWLQSPYRAIGVYIGGARYATGCRAANSANLTPAWVHRQAAKGWRFLPIYVGSQAWYPVAVKPDQKPDRKPDQGPDRESDRKSDLKSDRRSDRKSDSRPDAKPDAKPGRKPDHKAAPKERAAAAAVIPAALAPAAVPAALPAADPAAADSAHLSDFDGLSTDAAYGRAVTEADDAVQLASGLGFPVGSVIYYDMEGYPGTYRSQVLAYSRGWTAELHRLGYRSGWYSSSDSGIRDLSRAYGPDSPDVVDIANWNGVDSVEDPGVPGVQWSNHQRVHQSDGDHQETWGGVTLSIDSDWIDVGTANRGTVERLVGWDRDATAAAVSRRAFDCVGCTTPGRDQARSAVLSRNDDYADALGGAALAAQSGGPLLLTPSTRLSEPAAVELHRILGPGARVYLLGGPNALSTQVEESVRAEGFVPVRIAGHDRYQTAIEIARTISGGRVPSTVLVVSGADFPDALAASAAAGAFGTATTRAEQAFDTSASATRATQHGAVVVLTNGTTMPVPTETYLAAIDPHRSKLFTIGTPGTNALSAAHHDWRPTADFTPITAPDHAATAATVATQFFAQPTTAVIVHSHDWQDALAGSAVAAHWNAPLLYTDHDRLPSSTESYLSARKQPITTEVVIGGEKDIASSVATSIGDATTPGGLWDMKAGE